MKATKKTLMVTTVTVNVEMEKEEARGLATFLEAERLRRRSEFKKTSVMQCWPCLEACENLLQALRAIGITDNH